MTLSKNLVTLICCLLCFVAVFCSFTVAYSAEETSDPDAPQEKLIRYDFLAENEMPILGYIGVACENAGSASNPANNPSFFTKSNFQRYKDAGFNILSGLYEREPFHTSEIYKAFELCDELGLAYFVNDNDFRCESDGGQTPLGDYDHYFNLMQNKWYLNEKSFAGIAVKDEPSAKDFDGMKHVNKALKQLTDGKIAFTTLFPVFVETYRLYLDDPSGGIWTAYMRYVREYMDKVRPDVLVYDLYISMTEDGTLQNPLNSSVFSGQENIYQYMKSLSFYNKIADEYNVPFWTTVASYNHMNGNQYTKKQTEWMVNTSLAYGAKGMQYYTYWPTMDGTGPADWEDPVKSGMVTHCGTPHDTYYQIQEINRNIKMVDDVLMPSCHKGIIQYGTQNCEVELDDVLYGFGDLYTITGGDSFVGCFERDGKPVYYVVNNSVDAGITTFVAQFYNKTNVRLTNLRDGVRTFSDEYSVGFNLSGGQAVLLEVL